MATMIKYPETVQYREVVHDVISKASPFQKRGQPLPILKFIGTVKLHGNNAAIAYQNGKNYWCQSRNRIITPAEDNAGFANNFYGLANEFFERHVLPNCPTAQKYYNQGAKIVIFGEWCGGDIQPTVALCQLSPMFVIFKIRIIPSNDHGRAATITVDPEQQGEKCQSFWLEPQEWIHVQWHERSIYNIYEFATYEIDIDFKEPELSQDKLTKITEEVEQQCPVAAYFHVFGVGEGVVWTEWEQSRGDLCFKVKGRLHLVSQNRSLVSTSPTKFSNVNEFLNYACTVNRMQQAIEYMQEEQISVEAKHIDVFLRWLTEDIIKEEKDTMAISNINPRQIHRLINSRAEAWFLTKAVQSRRISKRK